MHSAPDSNAGQGKPRRSSGVHLRACYRMMKDPTTTQDRATRFGDMPGGIVRSSAVEGRWSPPGGSSLRYRYRLFVTSRRAR